MAQPFVGQIMLVGFNFAPIGWAFCDGSLLSISQNTALFSLLGTTYGGNGTTTFALPDLRGRVPVGFGNGLGLTPYVLGEQTGSEIVSLTAAQMPSHTHMLGAQDATGNTLSPSGAFLARGEEPTNKLNVNIYSTSTASPVTLNPATVQPSGSSQPHSNIQPVLAMNYIIALVGIFPSRN
ncbi:MAG: phage tail protein [Methylocella sp.]|jgi:microcystin-dependent protein